jgi:hypothetical protein
MMGLDIHLRRLREAQAQRSYTVRRMARNKLQEIATMPHDKQQLKRCIFIRKSAVDFNVTVISYVFLSQRAIGSEQGQACPAQSRSHTA